MLIQIVTYNLPSQWNNSEIKPVIMVLERSVRWIKGSRTPIWKSKWHMLSVWKGVLASRRMHTQTTWEILLAHNST